jgi:hypothetical protein
MNFFPAQRPHFIFAAYLVLSVIGVFTFTATPELTAFDFWKNKPITDGSVISMNANYSLDCLAEYSVKARVYSTHPSRKSTQIILFFGVLCTGIAVSVLVIKAAKPTKAPNSKSTLLLKLRI